jgi:hypothetical protein
MLLAEQDPDEKDIEIARLKKEIEGSFLLLRCELAYRRRLLTGCSLESRQVKLSCTLPHIK